MTLPVADNAVASQPSGGGSMPSGGSDTTVTSGTASEALIKAATAASSAESATAATKAGDTAVGTSTSDAGKVAATTEQPKPSGQPTVPEAVGTQNVAARVTELEGRMATIASNTRTKVFEAFGLDPTGINAETMPKVAAEVRTALQLLADLRRDPASFAKELGGRLEKPQKFTLPSGDVAGADGKTPVAYSPELMGKILDDFRTDLTRELMGGEQMREVLDFVQGAKNTRAQEGRQQQLVSAINEVVQELQADPYFKPNEQAVREEITRMIQENPRQVLKLGPRVVHVAFNSVMRSKVYPSIESAAEQRVRESHTRKAATTIGSQIPNHSGSDGKTPALRGPDDLAAHMRNLETSGKFEAVS